MNEQALEARRTYKREWNKRNREKVKQAQARYWERKAAEAAAAAAAQMEREQTAAETALQKAAADAEKELSAVHLTAADLEGLAL